MSIADIISSLKTVTAKDSTTFSHWVKPYTTHHEGTNQHQFIFFLKPEVTIQDQGVHLDKILELILKTFETSGVSIGAIRILAGDYLDKYNVMSEHYGVIAKISREGVKAISEEAQANLKAKFGEDIANGAQVLGGHEFLKAYPEFNPFSLVVLNDNLGTVRLAGGTYALKIKVVGKPVIILNPFHAYQLVPYTTKGHAIVIFEGLSKTSWGDLRTKVCGATDPAKAVEGSIRNLLLKQKDQLGLKSVDMGSNGVHMSAGPLEGMVELTRFFSDKEGKQISFKETNFGQALAAGGVSDDKISHFASNPKLDVDGKSVSAFDLTEEKDAEASVKILAKF